jgi:hypothetical protein
VLEACTRSQRSPDTRWPLEPSEVLVLLHDVDDAPIGEVTNDQLRKQSQASFVIERSGQRDVRLGQKLPFIFNAPSLGNVFEIPSRYIG